MVPQQNEVMEVAMKENRNSLFTAWITGVSNPVRSPCYRTLVLVGTQRAAFAFGVSS